MTRIPFIPGLALTCLFTLGVAHAQTEDRSWHLLQKQNDGLIRSVQHGLTQHECEFARARIMGLPATDEEIQAERARKEKEAEERKARAARCADPKREKPKANLIWDECDIGYSGATSRWINATDVASAECFQ